MICFWIIVIPIISEGNAPMKRVFVLLLILLIPLSSCSNQKVIPAVPDTGNTQQEPEISIEIEKDPVKEAPAGPVNPLTGISDGISADHLNRRPVAIMINNLKPSLPQSGISKADIIYEMLAEGSITRFIAIYKDPSQIGRIGTVRSTRPYYLDIAQGYNAILLHFGASELAYQEIASRKANTLDGIRGSWEGSLYIRDKERIKTAGLEHSVYTSGTQIEKALSTLSYPITDDTLPPAFHFSQEPSNKDGTRAENITIDYSSYITAEFEYHDQDKKYYRCQYGKPHMDEEYSQQVNSTNVFILEMVTKNIANSSLGWIDIETTGTGHGVYISNGRSCDITWSKDDYHSPIKFFDKSNNELSVLPGNSFICVVPLAFQMQRSHKMYISLRAYTVF